MAMDLDKEFVGYPSLTQPGKTKAGMHYKEISDKFTLIVWDANYGKAKILRVPGLLLESQATFTVRVALYDAMMSPPLPKVGRSLFDIEMQAMFGYDFSRYGGAASESKNVPRDIVKDVIDKLNVACGVVAGANGAAVPAVAAQAQPNINNAVAAPSCGGNGGCGAKPNCACGGAGIQKAMNGAKNIAKQAPPTAPAKPRLEKPCKVCKKMNDLGEKFCWACGVADPIP